MPTGFYKRTIVPLAPRLWAKVDKNGPVHPVLKTRCWVWTGPTIKGRGFIKRNGARVLTHRAAWELENGPIPDGLLVCHKCDNPPCLRVDHLFLGTCKDNMADAAQKGRMGGVRSGHVTMPDRTPRGESSGGAKLTTSEVRSIRALHKEGLTTREIARIFLISKSTIGAIVKRTTWRHV